MALASPTVLLVSVLVGQPVPAWTTVTLTLAWPGSAARIRLMVAEQDATAKAAGRKRANLI
jgi:hypothetical protein